MRSLVAVLLLAACSRAAPPPSPLRVGATPVPHAQLLREVTPVLAKEGVPIEVVEQPDYERLNPALVDGALDANYFQHQLYLDQFNVERGSKLVSVAAVHVEPLGLYARAAKTAADVPTGGVIAIPKDPTNGARALLLLKAQGLLTLREAVEPAVADVVPDARAIRLLPVEGPELPRALAESDAAVINTNYVLAAGLDPRTALAREDASASWANLLVVRPESANDPRVLALAKALRSDALRAFIARTYHGAVIPAP